MIERELKVLNRLGLHARPAAEFVRCVRRFRCTVTIVKDHEEYSASSILEVLTASLDFGSTMIIRADGDDAEAAIDELARLMERLREQEEG